MSMEPMSANRLDFPNQHITAVKVMDPRLQIHQNRDYVVLRGAQVNNCTQYFATNINNSATAITCNPPNSSIAISRYVLKRFIFDISITGTNTGASNILVPGFYAPRSLPILSVTNSESISINNDTLSVAPQRQFMPNLMCYHNLFEQRNGQLSIAPTMLDQFQEYSLGAGSLRNPLATYRDGSPYEVPRGGYIGMQILTNTSTTATMRLTVTEPIFLSPLVWDRHSNYTSALVGVESMAYQCTFADLRRVLSIVRNQGAPGVINIPESGIVVNLVEASLLFNYLTPDPIEPIPRSLVSSYFSPISYPTRSSTSVPAWTNRAVAPSSITMTMQSVQLSNIPRRIYIYARQDDSVLTSESSDTFLSLPQEGNPLVVTWGNNQFCSTWTTQDIYNVSVKNGYGYSFSQFMDTMGSVICLELGTDLGLSSDESASLLMNQQLGLTCRFVNTNPTNAVTPTLYVVVVSEGTFNMSNGSCSHSLGVLTRTQIINARTSPTVTYESRQNVYGGSFYDKLKSAASSLNNFAKRNRVVSSALKAFPHPVAKSMGYAAQALGYGNRKRRSSRSKRRMRGGNLADELSPLDNLDNNDVELPEDYQEDIYGSQDDKHVTFLE